MGTNFLVISISIAALIFGVFAGWFIAKIKKAKDEKKLMNNLLEVIDGKRSNVLNIDGKEYDASRFVVTNKDGIDVIIDLKGGVIKQKQYAKEKNKESEREERETIEQVTPNLRKDSRSIRKKKPTSRTRNTRLRRFG